MKKKGFFKIIGTVLLVITAAALIVLSVPFMKLLATEHGRDIIADKVRSFGVFAPLAFIFIEIMQIVAAFVPGAPVEIMSGILFSGFFGTLWCAAGVFIGTAIVFFLVRKFGRPLVEKVFPKKKLDNISILNNERKLVITVFLLFIIPGTPKDFLTYIAGLTKIKPSKFFLVTAAARLPSMTCSVLAGANLGKGHFTVSIIIFAAVAAASVIGWLINKRLLKNDQ